jgi:hypothetical protein
LLIGLILFVAVQFASLLAVSSYPVFRDPEYGCRLRILESRLTCRSERPFTVVMLGSSRTVNGFKPDALEAELEHRLGRPAIAFNLGITGAGPVHEMLILRRLLSRGIRPDLLLIEVLPAVFHANYSGTEAGRVWVDRIWLKEISILGRYGADLHRLRRGWWERAVVPCFGYRYAVLSELAPWALPFERRIDWLTLLDERGFVHRPRRPPPQEMRDSGLARTREQYQQIVATLHPGGLSCQALNDLLALCRREKIASALVLMPEGPVLRSWYSPQGWREFLTFLQNVAGEYGIPIINAREWICEEDFVDSHHLLENGAEILTQRLAAEAIPSLVPSRLLSARDRTAARAGDGHAIR